MISVFPNIFRVIVQLALAGGAIAFAPLMFLFCWKIPDAIARRDWSEVLIGALLPLGLFGIAALCITIFASREFYAKGRKIRNFVVLGIGSGLLVAVVLVAQFASQSPRFPQDWFPFYVTVGPAIVAVWNLRRLKTEANQSPEPTPTTVTPPAGQEARQP